MKAIALVTQSVLQSDLKSLFEWECREWGMELEFRSVTEKCPDYTALMRAHRNIITWNCKLPHHWTQKLQANILYIENSLICQSAGIFIDHRGFFSQSNLCQQQTWKQDLTARPQEFAREHFGWEAYSGGTRWGPILVCLQHSKDSNMRYEFPLAARMEDKLFATMLLLRECMPAWPHVIIRPSPRFLDDWNASRAKEAMWPDWELDSSGKFHEILPKCHALVTVNSTCASEAALLGIPTATLGTGAFTGSGATLECAEEPRRLTQISAWQPEMNACRRYTRAVLAQHFLPYRRPERGNVELQKWLEAAF